MVRLGCVGDVVWMMVLNVFLVFSDSRVRATWDQSPDAAMVQVGPDQRTLNGHRVYKFIVIEEPPMAFPSTQLSSVRSMAWIKERKLPFTFTWAHTCPASKSSDFLNKTMPRVAEVPRSE